MASRRAQIEALLEEDPSDVFLRYGLALEYEKEGQMQRALEILERLMAEDPPYVPAFHMSGQWHAQAGRLEAARDVLRRGIETARNQGRQHDAAEMSDLLTTIGAG